MYPTLGDWIAHDAIAFSMNLPERVNVAVDKMIGSLGDSVDLLGFGEALHGGEEILLLRNQLFKRLVAEHGYSAIAVESSFPKSQVVNEYVAGRGQASYEEVQGSGFSHGFGRLDANRELVEWMRHYNADPLNHVKLRFYGFDSPTEMTHTDSPRQVLYFVIDYLTSIDPVSGQEYRQRIDSLLGQDSDWENPAAMFDPAQSIGLSPAATALRINTEDLITELHIRRPDLVALSDTSRYLEAAHYASAARQLLNYHAVIARTSNKRIAEGLGLRDAMMADNLVYIMSRERGRGKVLAFAHNSHLKCGETQWQLGTDLLTWWSAGAHLNEILGTGYAVIGSALGVSEANGIGSPEAGTLEAHFTAMPGPVQFIPTHKAKGVPVLGMDAIPTRSGSTWNQSYFPLSSQSVTDFDWLAVFNSTTYNRGGTIFQLPDASPK